MDRRQRIAMQRALAHEALGKLRAAQQLFGTEDEAVAGEDTDYMRFTIGIEDFEEWLWSESPIA